MYRVKDDKRSRHSANLLKEGMIKCLRTKKLNEISISCVAKASGVSRATFYRMFDTPVDILSYICDDFVSRYAQKAEDAVGQSKDEVALTFIRFWADNVDSLSAVMKSGRHDLFQAACASKGVVFGPDKLEGFTETEAKYFRSTVMAILYNILFVWTKNGKKETPEQLFGFFKKFSKYDF